MLRTVSNSMQSVLILTDHGCGTDALKIARTMFETAVNIHYIDSSPESIQDYLDFQWIEKKRHYGFLAEFAPAQAQQIDSSSVRELISESARVAPRFTGPKGKVRPRWRKLNLRDIARKVGGEFVFSGLYSNLSSLIHMDALGLTMAKSRAGVVEAVPSNSNLVLGLQAAVLSYAMALLAADHALRTNREDRIQSGFEKFKQSSSVRDAVSVWNELAQPDKSPEGA